MTDPVAQQSLDDDLFRELQVDDDLLQGLETAAPGKAQPPGEPSGRPADIRELDRQLLERLQGQDEGAEGEPPLVRAGRRMREAELRIHQARSDRSTQSLQEQAIADLDELIEAARKQRQKQSGGAPKPRPSSRRSQTEQPGGQPQPRGGDGGESQQPARESSDTLRPDVVAEAEVADRQALMKDLWGHLPVHVREQMLQSSIEQFLPKYQLLIEQYFQRLIDDQSPRR